MNRFNIFVLGFAIILIAGSIFAISQKYQPGQTLNPNCIPGEENCTIDLSSFGGKWVEDNGVLYYNDGKVSIGVNSPSEKLEVDGSVKAVDFLYSSDKRLKKDIKRLENYRDILKIDAVRFNWKKDGKADVGIIAQEVQKYFPEFVHQSGNYLAVDYPKLAVPMINLLQEQERRIIELEKKLKDIEKK